MHTTNYHNTFIEVAEDCPVIMAEFPKVKGSEKTAVQHQFELIKNNPYSYTSDEVLFSIQVIKNKISEEALEEEKLRYFSKGQACLRASPLGKRYGWGIHYNAKGKIAIYPVESAEYQAFIQDGNLKKLKAMRSKKA